MSFSLRVEFLGLRRTGRPAKMATMIMTRSTNPQWTRLLDGIADELLRLAIANDVKLSEPGVIERILKNDESVCGRHNKIGFDKLRKLLVVTFDSLGKSVDRIGLEDTRDIVDAIRERMEPLRKGQ